MTNAVVVVVHVVDVVDVVVVDVRALQRLIALKVAFSAPQHLLLTFWVHEHRLTCAARIKEVATRSVAVRGVRNTLGHEAVALEGSRQTCALSLHVVPYEVFNHLVPRLCKELLLIVESGLLDSAGERLNGAELLKPFNFCQPVDLRKFNSRSDSLLLCPQHVHSVLV